MQGYALIANVVRKQEARLSGRLEGEYAVLRHGYSSPRVAGTLSYRSGDRLIELQAARYRQIDAEHGFGSRNRLPRSEARRVGEEYVSKCRCGGKPYPEHKKKKS